MADGWLPTNGIEVPFEGRKRATLELRAASFETNEAASFSPVAPVPEVWFGRAQATSALANIFI